MSKLNCIAINPQWHDEMFLSLPLGLATIVAIVKSEGHNVQVIDFDAKRIPDDGKIAHLSKITPKPDVLLLTGMITTYNRIYNLAKMTKLLWPDCITILGGSLATTAPDSILKKLDIDIFVIGEGDDIIKLLLEALSSKSSFENVPGVKFKNLNNIFFTRSSIPPDITKVPSPCYNAFPMHIYTDFYKKSGRCFEIYTSRGCPNKCIYCYHISGEQVRYRLVDDIISEIQFVKDNYYINRFSFEDDNFGINKKWINEFINKIRDLKIQFRFQAFVNAFDDNILDQLQEVGLIGVSTGMESGSPLILKEMNKNISLSKASKLFESLRKRNIRYNATFIIGMPGETDETIEMTKDFLIHNGFTTNYQLFFATPYPGTKLYLDALENQIIKNEITYIENLKLQDSININLTRYSDEKLIEWREYILNEVDSNSLLKESRNHSGITWKNEAIKKVLVEDKF